MFECAAIIRRAGKALGKWPPQFEDANVAILDCRDPFNIAVIPVALALTSENRETSAKTSLYLTLSNSTCGWSRQVQVTQFNRRKITMHLRLERYRTPVAELLLVTDDDGTLRALDFADYESRMQRLLNEHYGDYALADGAAPASIHQALDAYFDGDPHALGAIRIAPSGTPFQRAVWRAVRKIKFGTTKSYGQIAAQIGHASASRAVGAANGANPIAIVVPCHRVIGANGALTGYGGGLPRKRWLLDHELAHANVHA